MKDIVTPVPPEEVRGMIKKCLETAALVNYTRLSAEAKIEGNLLQSCVWNICSFLSKQLHHAVTVKVNRIHLCYLPLIMCLWNIDKGYCMKTFIYGSSWIFSVLISSILVKGSSTKWFMELPNISRYWQVTLSLNSLASTVLSFKFDKSDFREMKLNTDRNMK